MLDEKTLQQLRNLTEPDDDVDFLDDLINVFLDFSPKTMKLLEESIRAKDFASAKKAAHRLKGSAAELGATDFSDYCKKVEDLANDKDFLRLEELCEKVRTSYLELCTELKENWLSKGPT